MGGRAYVAIPGKGLSLLAELQTLASVEMEKFGWEEVAAMEGLGLAPCGPGSRQQRGEEQRGGDGFGPLNHSSSSSVQKTLTSDMQTSYGKG